MSVNKTVNKINKNLVLLYVSRLSRTVERIVVLKIVMVANRGFLLTSNMLLPNPYLYKKSDIATFNTNKPTDRQRIKFSLFIFKVLRATNNRQRIRNAFGNLVKPFVP